MPLPYSAAYPTISNLLQRHRKNLVRSTPIRSVNPTLYVSGNARIRPIGCTPDMAVFDWVEVNVVHVSLEVAFVADRVLPEAALPYSTLTFLLAPIREPFAGRDAA